MFGDYFSKLTFSERIPSFNFAKVRVLEKVFETKTKQRLRNKKLQSHVLGGLLGLLDIERSEAKKALAENNYLGDT